MTLSHLTNASDLGFNSHGDQPRPVDIINMSPAACFHLCFPESGTENSTPPITEGNV